MTKLDFSKVEQTLGEALHHIFVKTLVQGKTFLYPRAIAFFGNQLAKPSPQDSVIEALAEIQREIEEEVRLEMLAEQGQGQPGAAPQPEEREPESKKEPPAPLVEEEFPTPKEPLVSLLIVLRKRLLWLIRQRVANVYPLLGTTKEEIIALRTKKELSEQDLKRIQELLTKSDEITLQTKKRLGVETDDALVETEKKKHRTKRFNIRETWLSL